MFVCLTCLSIEHQCFLIDWFALLCQSTQS